VGAGVGVSWWMWVCEGGRVGVRVGGWMWVSISSSPSASSTHPPSRKCERIVFENIFFFNSMSSIICYIKFYSWFL
jgi:hypothetical protein